MANCGRNYFINYLKSEYGVHHSGPAELATVLRDDVKSTLRDSQIDEIEESDKLKDLTEDILYAAARALYIDQDFKSVGRRA
jgi:hypothetical protein